MRPVMVAVIALCPLIVHAREAATEITPPDAWEDLGTPVKLSRVYSQAVGKDTAGREVYYLGMTDAVRAFVLALDPLTGEGRQFNLDGYPGQVWSICAHSNGKAYATTGSGGIFELDAATGGQRFIGGPPEGEKVVWELYEAADGNLYGGTYPNCKLARVDLDTYRIEDLGRMDPVQMYVRTIAVEGDYIYCGCGVTAPAVWAYNFRTGEKTQLLPDEARQGAGWGRATKREDGRVYIYGNGGKCWRVSGLEIEPVAKPPHMPYYELQDGTRLFAYTKFIEKNQYLVVTPDGEKRMVGFTYDCTGTRLWDIFTGPDGRVYGNTETPITLFAYDPASGETQVYGNPVGHAGQVYASTWISGRLHMAAYSDCTYTIWDPALPWSFGTEEGDNPRRIGKTSRELQRAGDLILAPDGKHTIVAGIPGYGRSGGAIVIVDPEAAEFEVVKQPFLPQSPWRLSTTPDDDIIMVGTSLYGGSGAPRVITPGRLILWNWRTRETVREFTPWEDEYVIDSLLRIGDRFWFIGAPNGKIGVFDFTSGEIVHLDDWGYGAGHLQLREEDGMIYAAMGGHVVRIDPATREHEVIATYPGLHRQIALSGEWLYAFTNMHLLRIKLEP
ncbi:MAG: WD40 repeat domain-containing protein [Armatimonadetes bacterium]|nr:WD40 repeat domain-containing protein [Armatimonadota bacterium]